MQIDFGNGETYDLAGDGTDSIEDLTRHLEKLRCQNIFAHTSAISFSLHCRMYCDYDPDLDFEAVIEMLEFITRDIDLMQGRLERHLGAVEVLARLYRTQTGLSE